jgi:S-formylglutathione hydrolase FrmB
VDDCLLKSAAQAWVAGGRGRYLRLVGNDLDEGPGITRRGLLMGAAAGAATIGAAGVLVEQGTLPGRGRLHRALGLDGVDVPIPDVEPGPRAGGSFASKKMSSDVGWSVSYPPGSVEGDALPVLLTLHGRSGDQNTAFDDLGFDRFLAQAVQRGTPPFVVASVEGGTSYWHGRADGTDSRAMVIGEYLPLLADRGLDTRRLSLLGWSMGGFGALGLAVSGKGPALRSISTLSAALFESFEASAEGAFDDEADFDREDVLARADRLVGVPIRIDCGDADPFVETNRDLRARLAELGAEPEGGIQPGGHTYGYWRSMAPQHLAFAGSHLAPAT